MAEKKQGRKKFVYTPIPNEKEVGAIMGVKREKLSTPASYKKLIFKAIQEAPDAKFDALPEPLYQWYEICFDLPKDAELPDFPNFAEEDSDVVDVIVDDVEEAPVGDEVEEEDIDFDSLLDLDSEEVSDLDSGFTEIEEDVNTEYDLNVDDILPDDDGEELDIDPETPKPTPKKTTKKKVKPIPVSTEDRVKFAQNLLSYTPYDNTVNSEVRKVIFDNITLSPELLYQAVKDAGVKVSQSAFMNYLSATKAVVYELIVRGYLDPKSFK